jgi:hypothetical protein
MVRSLHLLRLNSRCYWFDLATFCNLIDDDLSVEVMFDGTVAGVSGSNVPRTAVLESEEIQTLARKSPILTWNSAVALFRDIRRGAFSHHNYYFPLFGGYKPFHILLPIQTDQRTKESSISFVE